MNTVKVKKLHPDAKLPTKAHPNDLGYDLYAHHIETIEYNDKKHRIKVKTGISIELPEGWGCFLKERSSLGLMGIAIRGGVIDGDYRGEIMVIMEIETSMTFTKGDKVAQLVPIPITNWSIEEVEGHGETSRGDKGFGSSGK